MFTNNASKLAGFAGAMLGWRPHEFWVATPAELMAIVVAINTRADGATPLNSAELTDLMERFPDE